MISWNFPPNNDGQNEGLNDAGIETYKGNPIHSLAREVIQNSLDAARPELKKPVRVEFTLHNFCRSDFPKADKFVDILKSCRKFGEEIDKTKSFFDNALEIFNSNNIPVLQISDYNTTGLTGAGAESLNNWNNLIKGDGISDKHVGAGGSFGIGKQAPFACSDLRTVFYSTKDIEGVKALQGVAKLITHKNKQGKKTQGTGYYGNVDRNRPILNENNIDKFYQRDDIGTDIYVFGFKHEDNWDHKIISSIIEHFFMAVEKKQLIIKVEKTEINKRDLSRLIEEYIKKDDELLADYYYRAVTSDDHYYFEENRFMGLGHLKMYILPIKDFPKRRRVAMVRETGMKIFDKGYFRTPIRFAGVLLAEGKDLNEHLRKMEPPSHDAWQPTRHPDEKKAENLRKKLYNWINKRVDSITGDREVEKLDIEGMSQFLPDKDEEFPIPSKDEDTKEKERTSPSEEKDITLKNETANSVTGEITSGTTGAFDENGNTGAFGGKSETEGGKSGGRYEGENTSEDEGEGRTENNKGNTPTIKERPLKLKESRVFSINPSKGLYKIYLKPTENCTGFLDFKVVGEDRKDAISINKAKVTAPNKQTINIASNGRIGPLEMEKGEEIKLILHIDDSFKFSMEVDAYES